MINIETGVDIGICPGNDPRISKKFHLIFPMRKRARALTVYAIIFAYRYFRGFGLGADMG